MRKFDYHPTKLGVARTAEMLHQVPIWLVTLQVHNREHNEHDTVWVIRWPSEEPPEIEAVMAHWNRYPKQFQLAGYVERNGFQRPPSQQ
jgi:hypothetical protein